MNAPLHNLACQCYVRGLEPEERFALRWGAHERFCPLFHESGDPVDRAADNETRAHYLQTRDAFGDAGGDQSDHRPTRADDY